MFRLETLLAFYEIILVFSTPIWLFTKTRVLAPLGFHDGLPPEKEKKEVRAISPKRFFLFFPNFSFFHFRKAFSSFRPILKSGFYDWYFSIRGFLRHYFGFLQKSARFKNTDNSCRWTQFGFRGSFWPEKKKTESSRRFAATCLRKKSQKDFEKKRKSILRVEDTKKTLGEVQNRTAEEVGSCQLRATKTNISRKKRI